MIIESYVVENAKRAWTQGPNSRVMHGELTVRRGIVTVTRALFGVCMGAVLFGGSCAASAANLETCSAPLPLGEWKPTVHQWGDALDVFKHEYARWEQKTGRTLRQFSDYRSQSYGVREKGRRLVFLSAFCSESWEQAPEWRTRLVDVGGGGSCFFRAKVDVNSGAIASAVHQPARGHRLHRGGGGGEAWTMDSQAPSVARARAPEDDASGDPGPDYGAGDAVYDD